MVKHTERFDPKSVGPLVDRAKAGDKQAAAQLIYQYQRLIASLVEVCTTAKFNPNPRHARHVQFLRLFCGAATDLQAMAWKIKRQLSMYDIDEIRSAGHAAAAIAIDKCKRNYTSTLVIQFAELIKDMIRDGKIAHMDEDHMSTLTVSTNENEILFKVFMASLTEEEWIWAQAVLDGETPNSPPPPSLVSKMKEQAIN